MFLQTGGVGLFDLPQIPIAHAAGATRTWDGGGADNNASTAANWSSDTAPVDGDFVVFDGTSTKNCTWNISSSTTFATFSVNSGYSGTISLNQGLSLSGDYSQATGTVTFNATGISITTAGSFNMTGGTLNHTIQPAGTSTVYKVNVSVAGDMSIGASASITVTGKGFPASNSNTGQGPTGAAGYVTACCNGGGGANGGDGGTSPAANNGGSAASTGSLTQPQMAGASGGDNSASSQMGPGGGVVILNVTGTLTVSGSIAANGSSSTNSSAGGGAGGSIWLTTGTIAGAGTITATGGAGLGNAGGGGGGKIAIYYTSASYSFVPSATFNAYGGQSATGSVSTAHGGAGTIYVKQGADNGDLILDNNSRTNALYTRPPAAETSLTFRNVAVVDRAAWVIPSGYTTTITSGFNGTTYGTSSVSSITVNSGGYLDLSSVSSITQNPPITSSGQTTFASTVTWGNDTYTGSGTTLGLSNFTLSSGTFIVPHQSLSSLTVSGGTLTFTDNTATTVSGNVSFTSGTINHSQEPNGSGTTAAKGVNFNVGGDFNIGASASINVTGLGFIGFPSGGPGNGQGPAAGQQAVYGGGANGGDGGSSTNGTTAQSGIGSITAPVTAGSGGANGGNAGGNGGGVVKLVVAGTLTVSGSIVANGNNSGGGSGGGGAGGSIWLDAGTLAGAGSITANGGTGGNNGGGGGGGKIALTYTTRTHNGTVTAYGSSGSTATNGKAAAGTIYTKAASQSYGDLLIDNNTTTTNNQTRNVGSDTFRNVTLSNRGQLTLTTALTLVGDLTINSNTTVTPGSRTITVGGNFANSGTFTAGTSTVNFDTAGTTSTVSGSTTFYNLSSTTAGKNITFTAGTTQTISNALTLTGSSGSYVTLRSSSTGNYWNVDPQGTRSVSYVDVKDSNNANAAAITATNTIDSGHNSNWTITGPPPGDPTINNYNNGAYINDNTPTLSFDLTDPVGLSVKYHIQIDDTADFSSPVVDEIEGSYSASPRSNVTYTPSVLSDGAYYWRVLALNTNGQSSSYTTANSGSVAFRVDATAPTSPSISINSGDEYTTSTSSTLTLSASDATSGMADMIISENSDFSGAAWEPYATSKSFALSSSDGTKTVYAKYRDAAGNESATASDTIVYDATAPSGSVSIDAGNAYATSSSVTLNISASDATSGVYQMQVSEDSGFVGASWENYATSKSVVLSGLDGTKTYYIRFKDNAGNISLATSDDIILDTAAPTGGSVSINTAATYSNSRNVTLAISALDSTSGVYQMQVSEDSGFAGASWEAYATSKAFTLAASDGTRTVYVRFVDNAGNISGSTSDSIILDRSGPIATDYNINSDAAYTTSADVTLTIGAIDITTSVQDMMISENSLFTGGAWETYATSKALTLSAGDGLKTVYIKFRDAAGNSSLPTFDTITLDTTMPDGSVTINSGDGYTQADAVTLALSASDNLGVAEMRVSEDSSFTGVPWEAYATTKAFTLSAGDGTKTVYAEFRDDAGNVSGTVNDAITYDATAPATNSIVINSGDANTATTSVILSLSSTDATSGTTLMEVSESATFVGASYEAYATTKAFTLSAGDGTHTVYARFKDAAGNVSSAVSDTIVLDTVNPSGSVTINSGDAVTAVRNVTLGISANDVTSGVSEMQVSESPTFVAASWEAYATSKAFMLSTVDGVKTVYVRFKDAAGNISSSTNDTIEYDSTAPGIVSFSINSDAAYTNSTGVTLAITGSDAGSGIYQMMISNVADFTGASWETYETSKAWTISSGDGTQTVYIKLRDTTLNVSDTAQDSILLDTSNPVGTIIINSGDTYANTTSDTLTLSATDDTSGVEQMMISESATFVGASWESYATSKSVTLSSPDGTKTVYAKFKDASGNVSSTVSDTIIQDTTAPTPVYVKINNNAVYTSSQSVTIKVSATDATTTVAQMMISPSASFAGAAWGAYATDVLYTLAAGDGAKTLYAKFKDAQGNISSAISSTIFLDATVPNGSVSINSGAATTSSLSVTLTISGNDAGSGIDSMQISDDPSFSGISSVSYATSKTFAFAGTDGTKTVYVRFTDAAGNVSPTFSDSISYKTPKTQSRNGSGSSSGDSAASGSTSGDTTNQGADSGSSSDGTSGQNGGSDSGSGNNTNIQVAQVQIKIVDSSNNPIPNAKVTLEDGTVAYTNSEGVVVFENISEGQKNLKVEYNNKVEERQITVSKDNANVSVKVSWSLEKGMEIARTAALIWAGMIAAGAVGILAVKRFRRKAK